MLTTSVIINKRLGKELSDDEIRYMVDGFCSGQVADYQMSAFAMAICLKGMNARETTTLTGAMLESGDRLPRPTNRQPSGDRVRVDKHSTGGLGDNVSLILAPLLATCGVDVPMISGRGLGLTGGTLDKLESIDGFQVDLSAQQTTTLLAEVGACIVAASDRIAPADRRLYALRDVTGTVESIPLITASILSKKLAANLDALVMDVKVGCGGFMHNRQDADDLAQSIVSVGTAAGMPTTAILSDMDQPLSSAIGNAIEVNDAIEILAGKTGPVRSLTLELCGAVLVTAGKYPSRESAVEQLIQNLDSGHAMERFERMVHHQGGRLSGPISLAPATDVVAASDGFVDQIDCQLIGQTIVSWGGGRRKAGDAIDHQVGIKLHVRIGDPVERGQNLMTIYCRPNVADDYAKLLSGAVRLKLQRVEARPLILSHI